MQVYVRHATELGYCRKGVREFCKAYGIDYINFIRNGIDSKELEATGSEYATNLIRAAEQESSNGQ